MKNQGINASRLFHGKAQSEASRLLYSESTDLFSKLIRRNLKPGNYTLVDLGGHKGEFLSELINNLREYKFTSVIVDSTGDIETNINAKKIVADITEPQFRVKSIDLVILRYVLAWNSLDKQKQILNEVQRICRGICIIQHQGTDHNDSPFSQEEFGKIIPAMKRNGGVFTSPVLIEEWMKSMDIKFEIVQNRRIEKLSDIAIEKYSLNTEDSLSIRKMLKGRDYIIQTTWLLKFD